MSKEEGDVQFMWEWDNKRGRDLLKRGKECTGNGLEEIAGKAEKQSQMALGEWVVFCVLWGSLLMFGVFVFFKAQVILLLAVYNHLVPSHCACFPGVSSSA